MFPPVFIVGMPRSGTTLLGMMLNAHNELSISPETHYFNKYYKKCEHNNCLQDVNKYNEYLKDFIYSEEVSDMELSNNEKNNIFYKLINSEERCHSIILSEIISTYAKKQEKKMWGEKTPAHLEYVQTIMKLFPKAKIICIYRDPRDVALSLSKVPWNKGNVLVNAKRWKRYVALTDYYKKNYKDNFLEVKYEDLVKYPELVLKKICAFIGISYSDAMLRYDKKAKNFNVSKEPWKIKNIQPIDENNVCNWVTSMSKKDIFLIEVVTQKKLKEKGYEVYLNNANMFLKIYFAMCYLFEFFKLANEKMIKKIKSKIRFWCRNFS